MKLVRLGRVLRVSLAGLVVFGSTPALNAGQFVQNGGFETNGGTGQVTTTQTGSGSTTLADWNTLAPITGDNSQPFVFVVDPTTADTAGFSSQFTASSGNNIYLWGPGQGVNNGLSASPDGGDVLGSDGGYANGWVYQSISGLTVGASYTLSFYWAASQFTDQRGATTQGWDVSWGGNISGNNIVGGTTVSTSRVENPSQGFSGWYQFSTTLTATSTSQILGFLSYGSPALPPFALLDGVSLTEDIVPPPPPSVPEPSTLVSVGLGALGLVTAGLARRRRRSA